MPKPGKSRQKIIKNKKMKKMLILAGLLLLSGVWYAQMYAAAESEKAPVAEEVAESNEVEYTVWRNEDASEGYDYTYLIDFYNNTDRQVYIEYDYRMKSDGRWILRNSFHIGPKSSARNYHAGDVGEVRVRWQYE